MLTIYKASAGSGKTYTLAYEYIKLLLGVRDAETGRYRLADGPRAVRRPHARILAITFSNKATAEMKGRIIRELDALARGPRPDGGDAAYAGRLTRELDCPRERLTAAARHALHELLHDYGSFNVSTIDSFFQTVLRTFAREIDRQGDYRIEMDQKYVLGAALGMLFDELNDADDADAARPRVLRWLEGLAGMRVRDGKDFNPFFRGSAMYGELLGWLETALNDRYGERAGDIGRYLADGGRIDRLEQALGAHIDGINGQIAADTSALLQRIGSDGLMQTVRRRLESMTVAGGLPEDDTADFLRPKTKYMLNLRGRVPEGCFKKGAAAPDYDALFDWYAHTAALLVERNYCRRLADSLDSLRALGYINRYVARFRVDNNLILISDTNSLLRSIIRDDETPFIYERIGRPLEHFLIDEFQDTSRMQWLNLRPLVANSLAETHDSLIIGDVKQSIYRWRGAESSLLDREVERDDFPRQSVVRGAAPGENTNYRSAHGIVQFNNTVFARIAADTGVRGYGGIEQTPASGTAGLGSYITVAVLTPDTLASEPSLRPQASPGASQPADAGADPREVAMERLAAGLLDAHSRGYAWRDMCVLCRRRADMAVTVDYLMRRHPEISVMSDEALLVRNAASVKLIISMLEILDKTAAGVPATAGAADASAGAAPGPVYRTHTDAEILCDRFEYFLAHGSGPDAALALAMDAGAAAAPGAPAGLDEDLEAIRAKAPANLVALAEAVIERKVPVAMRAAEQPYLVAFMDAVADFTASYNPSVHAFLEYWSQKSGTITIGSGAGQDSVSVMTVHAAKGLEWDVVYIPLMDWTLQASPEAQWIEPAPVGGIDPDLLPPLTYYRPGLADTLPGSPVGEQVCARVDADTADNLNVAYVAFTRAARELHINVLRPRKAVQSEIGVELQRVLAEPPRPGEAAPIHTDLSAGVLSPSLYVAGAPTSPRPRAESALPAIPAAPYRVSYSELNRAAVSLDDLTSPGSSDPDTPEGAAPADPVDAGSTDERRLAARRGTVMHAVLAAMRSPADLDEALASVAGACDEAERALFRQTIISAFSAHPVESGRWFDPDAPRVLVEQPIYEARRGLNFRPDRIVWCADGHVDVVDYKFTAEEHDSHRVQVAGYAGLLRSMGIGPLRAYVWYPELRRIVPVTGV